MIFPDSLPRCFSSSRLPHPLPLVGERPEILRHDFEAFRVTCELLPRLGAPHVDVSDRPQPGGVVERSGADSPDIEAGVPFAVDPAAAITAEPIGALHATGAGAVPRLGLTSHNTK